MVRNCELGESGVYDVDVDVADDDDGDGDAADGPICGASNGIATDRILVSDGDAVRDTSPDGGIDELVESRCTGWCGVGCDMAASAFALLCVSTLFRCLTDSSVLTACSSSCAIQLCTF